MKHTKRWVSLLLAVMMTVAAPLSAFAAWEDGFVIPGQNRKQQMQCCRIQRHFQ